MKGVTPYDEKMEQNISDIKIKRNELEDLSSIESDDSFSNLNALQKKENMRIENKKIVNNKPSQFGPILGVNFHNIKK